MSQSSLAQPLRYEFAPFSADGDDGRDELRQSLSEHEIEALREAAFRQGEARARAEAEAGLEHRRVEAIAAAANSIRSLVDGIEATRGEIEEGAATLSLAVGRALGGHAIARAPIQVIRPMIAEALEALYGEARVVVEVHEAIVDVVRGEIETIVAETGFAGRVRVRAGADNIADCRIDWGEGGIERRLADIERGISDRVAAHGIALPPARVVEES